MHHKTHNKSLHLLSTAKAARFLGCQPQTLRKWRLTGGGPKYVRLGESTAAPAAYRLSDLEAWISRRVFSNTSEEATKKPEPVR